MPQIFGRGTNSFARITIILAVVLATAVAWFFMAFQTSPYMTHQGEMRVQPVQFSHMHHVGGMGFDCRYCHTGVETSSFAGIPPTRTCMNCHSQIWADSPFLEPVRESFRSGKPLQWVRVDDLPDYVYFNHSIHIYKGIGCETCHGRVDKMAQVWQANTLQMNWCLDCHRHPEQYVRPRDQVFNMEYEPPKNQLELGLRLVKEYKIQSLTDCWTCHR